MSLDITPLVPKGQQAIQSYGNGGFRVTNVEYTGSLIVFTDKCVQWNCASASDINFNSFQSLHQHSKKPEILIIGCGDVFTRPPQDLIDHFKTNSIALEWMTTGAACRTYNILALEGRGVAAAIIAVE